MKRFYSHSAGFTLIELLIVLSIATILFSWVLCIKSDFLLKNTLSMRTKEIVMALHYARSQAMLLGQPLILAPKLNNNWSTGMILFFDRNNNHVYDVSDTLFFQWQWHDAALSLSWSGLYENYILFTSTALNSVLGGSFCLCPTQANGEKASVVVGNKILMNRVGRIRVEVNEETCHT